MPRNFIILFIALIALTFAGLSTREFSTRGEPREALVAQAMRLSGNYILPRAYGGDVPSKPPLLHWLISVGAWIEGDVTELSARLPSAIASLVFIMGLYVFLARRRPQSQAIFTCFVLASCVEWYRTATVCRVDMLFSVGLSGGLFALLSWFENRKKSSVILAIFLLALASLSKGPAAVVISAAIFGVYLLTAGEHLLSILKRGTLVYVPVLLVAAIWYLLAYQQEPVAFLNKVYYENVARFASTMEDEPHKHSAFYLYLTVLLGFMPWTLLFLPMVLPKRKPSLSFPGFSDLKQGWNRLRNMAPLERFSLISVVVVLMFFSIPSSKRSVYVLSAYPFIAILVATALSSQIEHYRKWYGIFLRMLCGLVIALSTLVLLLQFFPGLLSSAQILQKGDAGFFISLLAASDFFDSFLQQVLGFLPLVVAFIILFLTSSNQPSGTRLRYISLLVTVVYLSLNAAYLPQVSAAVGYRKFSEQLKLQIQSSANVYSYGTEFYGLSFYLKHPFRRLAENTKLQRGDLIVVELNAIPKLKERVPQNLSQPILVSSYGLTKPNSKVALFEITTLEITEQSHENTQNQSGS